MQKEENEERGSLRFAFVIRFGALAIGGDRVDWESGSTATFDRLSLSLLPEIGEEKMCVKRA